MAPKNGKGNNANKTGKGNKDGRNKVPIGGVGKINTSVVSTPVNANPVLPKPIPQKTVTTQPDIPTLIFPSLTARPIDSKKWCLTPVSVLEPVIEKRNFDTKDLIPATPPYPRVESSYSLKKNTVVNALQKGDADPSSWSGITYEVTTYDKDVKNWVTTTVTGWVDDAYLDDYREHEMEEFQRPVVEIRHQTKYSTDAQQYMTIIDENYDESKARYNMCGELCVAFLVKKDIDTALADWKKNSKSIYNSMVGRGHDEPLGPYQMEDLLTAQGTSFERYKDKVTGQKISLAADNDPRRASDGMAEQLQEHYFITNLKINTNTGALTQAYSAEERNHWVVVDGITQNGSRIELYNPFPNKMEEYSFGEFYKSVRGDPNSGWWIKRSDQQIEERKNSAAHIAGIVKTTKVEPPKFKVHLETPKRPEDKAEQYIWIEGKKKTQLCGEFCVAYIVSNSINETLDRWNKKQKTEPAGLRELATLLTAYGYQNQAVKPFSMTTVLDFWKVTQPKLYEYHVRNNKPTGTWELSTILKAYGYTNAGDFMSFRTGLMDESILVDTKSETPELNRTGVAALIRKEGRETEWPYKGFAKELAGLKPGNTRTIKHNFPKDYDIKSLQNKEAEMEVTVKTVRKDYLPSPGRIKKMLKTHFLIVGVGIHGTTGKLISGDAVRHWVVLENITPVGGAVGGNGGWAELYNPFTNIMEEYSCKELTDSMSETGDWGGDGGLWVKRDITPKFIEQVVVDPAPEVRVMRIPAKPGGKDKKGDKPGKDKKNDKPGKGEGKKNGNKVKVTRDRTKIGGKDGGKKAGNRGGKKHG